MTAAWTGIGKAASIVLYICRVRPSACLPWIMDYQFLKSLWWIEIPLAACSWRQLAHARCTQTNEHTLILHMHAASWHKLAWPTYIEVGTPTQDLQPRDWSWAAKLRLYGQDTLLVHTRTYICTCIADVLLAYWPLSWLGLQKWFKWQGYARTYHAYFLGFNFF